MYDDDVLETPFAWIHRDDTGVVIQQWKPDIVLDAPTIRATMLARHERYGDQPHAVIVVVPEGTGFALSFLDRDQYGGTPVAANIIAMANVVEAEDVRAIVELYYAQHPPAYRHAVFATMEPARAWVVEQLRKPAG